MSISKTVEILVNNIIQMRKAKGWNKSELARRCGVDQSYISRIEKADRHIGLESVEKFAEAFGVEVYELFLVDQSNEYALKHRLEQIEKLPNLKRQMIESMIDAFVKEMEMEK